MSKQKKNDDRLKWEPKQRREENEEKVDKLREE
jgi:hypothetical protein